MNISIGARTDVGGRTNNEDCLAVLDRERVPLRADAVLVIADGMGGRANGEEASGIAVKIVRETLMELLDPTSELPLPPAEDILAAAMRRANSTVYELSQENPDTPGMGTTCIAALVSEGLLTLAHVGDSRAYLVRNDEIRTLTADHTYVADQVRAGNMTEDAAKKSRFRNVITRAIGIAPTVQPDFETFPLLDTDTVLLCTDGLSNTLEEKGILEVVKRCDTAQGTANSLLEAAKAGGVRDNVTIIAVRVAADVQSGRVRRIASLLDNNGLKIEDDTKPEKLVDPVPNPTNTAPPPPPVPAKGLNIGLAIMSALMGAAIGAGALFEISYLRSPSAILSQIPANQPTVAGIVQRPDFFSLNYQPPAQFFYKPIRPNFLLLSTGGVYVALAQSGKVVHLNSTGKMDDKVPPETLAPLTAAPAISYGVDSAGNLYLSSGSDGTITQINADGTGKRVVVQGMTRPTAVAVSEFGDIYVIDNGELFVAHPVPTGKP